MILLSDITATETTNMNIENKEVTLRSKEDNVYTVIKDSALMTQILDINNSNTVTTTNIIFDGNHVISSGALIESRDSTLNLNEGTIVQNNINIGRHYSDVAGDGGRGSGIYMRNGTLNMKESKILNNKINSSSYTSQGGGIYFVNGTINLYSGIISDNVVSGDVSQGGGFWFANVVFNMYNGTIQNNSAGNRGGGIMLYASTQNTIMNMFGGIITKNIVELGDGGGISVQRGESTTASAIVYIKAGILANNIAPTGPNTYAHNGAQIIDER